MATAGPLNLLVDCLICEHDKVDRTPRLLPCKHSFCESCLSKTSSIRIADKLRCPVCFQMTQLSERGIQDLPIDTSSATFRKSMRTLKDIYWCTLCGLKGDKSGAVARCSDCEFRLCQQCSEAHKENEAFSSHQVITDLCKIHIRDLSHACLTCRTGLCFECIISKFHDEHETCDITEVQEKATDMMTQAKHLLQEETNDLDKKMNQAIDESMDLLKQRRKETEDKLEQYRKKMLESIGQFMEKRDEKYHKGVMTALSKQNETCTRASNCLNEINILTQSGKLVMLKQLVQKTSDIFKALDAIRTTKHLEISVPTLLDDHCATTENIQDGKFGFSCTFGDIRHYSPEVFTRKPKLRLSLTEKDGVVGSLCYIKALQDGSAVLGHLNQDNSKKVSVEGQVMMNYSTKGGGDIRGIDMHGGDIFVGTYGGQKVECISGLEERPVHLKPPLNLISDIAVDGDDLILSDESCLWRYSIHGKRKGKISVGHAWRICVGVHPLEGTVYLVSDDEAKELRVYKPDGKLLRTIGREGDQDGEFLFIGGSSMMPNGNILVTDPELHRVSEFSFDGKFIRHLLIKEDGIEQPYDVSFEHNFLWVACWEKAMLFSFDM